MSHIGDYWRWDAELFRIDGVGTASGGGHLLYQMKAIHSSREVELLDLRLRKEGRLVWTDHPVPDETYAKLDEARGALRDLRNLGHAIHATRHRIEGETGRHLGDLGHLIGELAAPLLEASGFAAGIIARDNAARRAAARRALNDELGIPNCDHLILDPSCAECTKEGPR